MIKANTREYSVSTMCRVLQVKGYPYDNAVAEAAFKVIKTEFIWNETFHTLEELKLKL